MLTEIADTKTWVDLRSYVADGDSWRETWSKAAGKTCPDEEIEAFRAALGSPSCAQEALFGWSQRRMATDPVPAILYTLQALEEKVPSDSRSQALAHLFRQGLPGDVDFETLEKLLPTGDYRNPGSLGPHDPLTNGRPVLFEKWAKDDALAAANYVMENPERCSPKLIETISEGVKLSDPAIAREWVAHFPAGPYLDEAADKAVWLLAGDSPDEARELASQISDPGRRDSALKRVEFHQKVKRGEASFEDGR